MNDLPVFLSIYVDALVTIETLYTGYNDVLYEYTLDVLSVMAITMKFVPTKHVLALDSISLVAKVLGRGFNIVHLLLD